MSEKPLNFKIEMRGPTPVLVWFGGGCRPATEPEIAMWDILSASGNLRDTQEKPR